MQFIYLSLVILVCSVRSASAQKIVKPNVLVTTDINNAGGDPDDKQSLLHLLWYANDLNVVGIIPEAWESHGYEASMDDLDKYRKDFIQYGFAKKGFPEPDSVIKKVAHNEEQSVDLIINSALNSQTPLYVLVWGNMLTLHKALSKNPSIVEKIRVLTIATGVKYGPADEVLGTDCNAVNWNGRGRNQIFKDKRFDKLWWLENNWTYNGMFSGSEPKKYLDTLSQFGAMGSYLKEIVKPFDWANYFQEIPRRFCT